MAVEAVWPRREVKGSPAASREPAETDACRDFTVKNNSTLLCFHPVVNGRIPSAAAAPAQSFQAAGVASAAGNGTVLLHAGLRQSAQPSTVCSH